MFRDNKKYCAGSASLLLIMVLSLPLYAQKIVSYDSGMTWGIKGGYSHVVGTYGKRFSGSEYLGLYYVPYTKNFFMGEIDLFYSAYPLNESGKSRLYSASLGLGPILYYPAASFFQIYAGVSFKLSYLYLKGDLSNKTAQSVKPGFIAKAGFIFPIKWGIRLRSGFEYTYHVLSGDPFHGLNYILALSFNYDSYVRTRESAKIKFDDRGFPIDPEKERILSEARDNYRRGLDLVKNEKYYDSIPLLEKAAVSLDEARRELEEVRKRLSPEVPMLEKKGIEAYEQKDYKRCIDIMRRIKLINPNNRVMQIYLPRALNRYEALQKLK